MRQMIFFVAIAMFLSFMLETSLNASVIRGKKYYIRLLKVPCGFYGNVMGKMHTVHEWQKFYENGQLGFELKRICPKSEPITSQKQLKHLSEFLEYFASDSGNVPSCSQ